MMRNAGIPVVEIMDADGRPMDSWLAFRTAARGWRWPSDSESKAIEHIGFMGTKMPLDHRARKRLKALLKVCQSRCRDRRPGVLFWRFALAKGREMTESMSGAQSRSWISSIIQTI